MKITQSLPATTPLLLLAGIGLSPVTATATEGNGSVYPNGGETFLAGTMGPAGTFGMAFYENYEADRLNDTNGNNLNVPGFKISANALAPRFIWQSGVQVLGGELAVDLVVPLVNLKVSVGSQSQSKTGIGDITTGAAIGYHFSPNLHAVAAMALYVPTGEYNRNDLANLGRNYWALEPIYCLTYVDPNGITGDVRMGYIFNQRNSDTGYLSGQEFHFDYAAGWGFGHGLTAGLGGYYYQQVTPDDSRGTTLANSKGKAFAVGPALKYDSSRGWLVTLKWQQEFHSENRPQGRAIWLRAAFPL